jgi:DMSO/TMAO reductase YedYZ molybdopterin-dependent catalytic subunit
MDHRGRIAFALLAGIAGTAGSALVAGGTPSFIAVPVNAALVDAMPGAVVAVAIQTLGHASLQLVFALSTALTSLGLALAALAGITLGQRFTFELGGAAAAVIFGWDVAMVLMGTPIDAFAVAIPMGIVVGIGEYNRRSDDVEPTKSGRRRLLGALAGVLSLSGTALITTPNQAHFDVETASPPASLTASETREAIDRQLESARQHSMAIDGLPDAVSETADFYVVDKNAIDPIVPADTWALRIHGAVETEMTITYAELTKMAVAHRFVTLRCIGEALNGTKMDTALWTGVLAADLLDLANPQGKHVVLRAADNYDEAFPLAALRPSLLAYGMNGDPLPRAHGYPVRALVPGHWGEVNVKWLTEIEVRDAPLTGYWERRGWHGTGPVTAVAKLWTVNHLSDGRIQLGGYAYAGTRGIERVEVSTDGGHNWTDATLSTPLPGDDVWRGWSYEYDSPDASHEVVLRAIDGGGNRQPRQPSGPFPKGPSGWVSRTIRP